MAKLACADLLCRIVYKHKLCIFVVFPPSSHVPALVYIICKHDIVFSCISLHRDVEFSFLP